VKGDGASEHLRVAVFGASGNIGRHVVDQLLAAGHRVTAYVRNPSKLTGTHPNLTVVGGELDDAAAIARAVEGADAVISALGPSLERRVTGTPVTDGTRSIVEAMKVASVRRFVGLATPSIPDPQDRFSLTGVLVPRLARLTLANAYRELVGMTEAVTASDLDWTIARIIMPTDQPARNTVRAGFLGHTRIGWAMSRADIATFLVSQLTDPTWRRALPTISN
jgi:uncharacterized protein YbjT (DUF2867 family)